jgi:hypothetical protein
MYFAVEALETSPENRKMKKMIRRKTNKLTRNQRYLLESLPPAYVKLLKSG